jgi:NAD(P)-dependent dehydrogenase (short-subunit alcohol dehydrogenase family)
MTNQQRILITGTNSGFGLLMVQSLAKKGHTVFAGMRETMGKNKPAAMELAKVPNVKVIDIDVTNDASVADAFNVMGGVDVVINNAGVFAMGHVETFSATQMQQMFDVNVFGAYRVDRAALPAMRKNKSGLIIHISSSLARLSFPFIGLYSAAKSANELLAESLKYELAGTGVDVCVVQPGAYDTGAMPKTMFGQDQARAADYPSKDGPNQLGQSLGKLLADPHAAKPQLVADAVVALVEGAPGKRSLRTVVDKTPMGPAVDAINGTSSEMMRHAMIGWGMGSLL